MTTVTDTKRGTLILAGVMVMLVFLAKGYFSSLTGRRAVIITGKGNQEQNINCKYGTCYPHRCKGKNIINNKRQD